MPSSLSCQMKIVVSTQKFSVPNLRSMSRSFSGKRGTVTTKRPPALRHIQHDVNNGRIVCTKDSKTWCEHIESALMGGYDEPTFWTSHTPQSFIVRVPIIPTQNMYAQLGIHQDDSTRPYRAYLLRPDKPENAMGIDLGITGPGEALKIWRGMIWDYFSGVVDAVQKCANNSHSFQAQNKLAADLRLAPQEPAPRAQIWCMWYHKMCTSCYDSKNLLFNGDDLVPDDQGNRRNWSNLQAAPRR